MKNNYAFIDNQNLNLGIQKLGWKMDWRKFRAFLREKYSIEQAYMFIGYMPENEDLYNQMHEAGYLVVLKPTLEMFKTPPPPEKTAETKEPYRNFGEIAAEPEAKPTPKAKEGNDNQRQVKGNVDAELVLWAVKEMPNYDKAIIISGDGDFFSLLEYLREQGKLANLMVPNRQYSTLLKPFEDCIVRLDQLKRQLNYRHGRAFHRPKKG